MAVKVIEKENFQKDVLESEKPIVVDFWAPWCGYCRRLAPAVERLEGEVGEKVTIASVNVDDLPEVSDKYTIDLIPTLILFKDGKEVDRVVNPPSQDAMLTWLEDNKVL